MTEPARSVIKFDHVEAASQLWETLRATDFAGWDPYDALSSPVLRGLARGRVTRTIAVQALRRSPVNLRRILGVPRQQHTKGLALCLSAAIRACSHDGHGIDAAVVDRMACTLASRGLPVAGGIGWGYEFDSQTRWSFYPANTPNAVVTTFVANALADYTDHEQHAGRTVNSSVSAALSGVTAFLRTLVRESPFGTYYAYHPASEVNVHNASALVAATVCRCSHDSNAASEALRAAETVVRSQRSDGSWVYGPDPRLAWTDGYHTAYIISSLFEVGDRMHSADISAAASMGLDYYRAKLVDPDGAARSSPTSRYPIDTHAIASGISMLASWGDSSRGDLALAERMTRYAIESFALASGHFAYQRGRHHRKAIPYVRWSDSHMILALETLGARLRREAQTPVLAAWRR